MLYGGGGGVDGCVWIYRVFQDILSPRDLFSFVVTFSVSVGKLHTGVEE